MTVPKSPPPPLPTAPVKLVALDAQDLEVLAAHLQDAVLLVGDMAYLPAERRFAALVNRFDWASAVARDGRGPPTYERRRAALRFERVLAAQTQKLARAADTVLSLLTVSFERAADPDDPGGYILLVFSGGASVRLEVECIEATISDLGPVWRTKSQPGHPELADTDPQGK